ncbi:MAG: patatin-like phospholipase family protein [Candidatus Lernaella stagnicola]|nr:patatin-like phospholipase family protein [Candidatus Lernaella stagnicola]
MGITIVQKSDLSIRKKNAKTALVLAGGAVSGGAYKLGGLKALTDLMINRDIIDFEMFVGLSAGALIACPICTGISPEEVLKSLDGRSDRLSQLKPLDFYNPNISEFIQKPLELTFDLATTLPRFGINFLSMLFSSDKKFWGHVSDFVFSPSYKNFDNLVKILVRIAAASQSIPTITDYIPSGIFENSRLEAYIRHNLEANHVKNDFVDLYHRQRKELYITATKLDTGERVVFGHDENCALTISEAIQASTALPGFYKPARIKGIDYVDGAVAATANIDVAVEHGASLVICYNPFRPLENRLVVQWYKEIDQYITDKPHLAAGGMVAVINQVFRMLLHHRLHQAMRYYAQDPNFMGDIILIEPGINDVQFFEMNPVAFWQRAKAAERGFLSVKQSLEEQYPMLKKILGSYGIETSMVHIEEDARKMESTPNDEAVIGVLGKERLKRDIKLVM